jgi:hypothetical protein
VTGKEKALLDLLAAILVWKVFCLAWLAVFMWILGVFDTDKKDS